MRVYLRGNIQKIDLNHIIAYNNIAMVKYERGLRYLARYLTKNKSTVVLLGGSAANVESDLTAIGSSPRIVKSPSRQCLTDYVEDVKRIAAGETDVVVVEDHSISNGKILFIGEKLPHVEVVSIIGKRAVRFLPNCRVLEVDKDEAEMLHRKRSTSPAYKL